VKNRIKTLSTPLTTGTTDQDKDRSQPITGCHRWTATISVAVVGAIAVLCLGLVWPLPRSAAGQPG